MKKVYLISITILMIILIILSCVNITNATITFFDYCSGGIFGNDDSLFCGSMVVLNAIGIIIFVLFIEWASSELYKIKRYKGNTKEESKE